MKVEKIDIEGNLKLEAVCTYLEDIASSLREGRICLSRNAEFVSLTPSDLLEVSIAAGSKKGKEKISLRLEWKTELNAPDSQNNFAISSKEPVQEKAPEKAPEESPEESKEAPKECAAKEPEKTACPTKAAEPEKETAPAKPAETKAAAPKAAPKPAAKKPASKGKKASK